MAKSHCCYVNLNTCSCPSVCDIYHARVVEILNRLTLLNSTKNFSMTISLLLCFILKLISKLPTQLGTYFRRCQLNNCGLQNSLKFGNFMSQIIEISNMRPIPKLLPLCTSNLKTCIVGSSSIRTYWILNLEYLFGFFSSAPACGKQQQIFDIQI